MKVLNIELIVLILILYNFIVYFFLLKGIFKTLWCKMVRHLANMAHSIAHTISNTLGAHNPTLFGEIKP